MLAQRRANLGKSVLWLINDRGFIGNKKTQKNTLARNGLINETETKTGKGHVVFVLLILKRGCYASLLNLVPTVSSVTNAVHS
jgi:hypothetical protein